jgi:hypothetical protein
MISITTHDLRREYSFHGTKRNEYSSRKSFYMLPRKSTGMLPRKKPLGGAVSLWKFPLLSW